MSKQAHVGVEIFVKKLPNGLQKSVLMLATVVSIFFFGIMIYQGYLFSLKTMAQTSPVLHLPMGFVYSIIPISGIFLTINLVYNTVQELRKEGA